MKWQLFGMLRKLGDKSGDFGAKAWGHGLSAIWQHCLRADIRYFLNDDRHIGCLFNCLHFIIQQCWCHFKAFECIFHLSITFISSFHQLALNQQNRTLPNLCRTLYIQLALTMTIFALFQTGKFR